jgi:hypothetical protein
MDLMTTVEVASLLRITRVHLWRIRRSDPTFPPAYRPNQRNGRAKYDRNEVLAWLKTTRSQPSEETKE